MITKPECFSLTCDVCGREFIYDENVTHFSSKVDAISAAEDSEWIVYLDDVWCSNCDPPCVCGDSFWAHDGGDRPCEECGNCDSYRRATI